MSIENISRISYKKCKDITFLFDVPSTIDDEALESYLLTVNKNDVTIKKLFDFGDFLENIKNFEVKEIKPDSKEYKLFLKSLNVYIKESRYKTFMDEDTDTLISDDDLITITKHYKEEIKGLTLKNQKRDY